jgi:radical SAM protein with 4Fe4S-binding SPASM domain
MSREKGFMKLETFKKLIDECSGHDVAIWLHVIGEPLLHPDIFEMIEYARKKNIGKIGLSTNGTLFGKDMAEKILRSGLTRLECSLDAVDQESYREIRQRDGYDILVGNIRYLLQRKKEMKTQTPVISIQFVKTKKSRDFLRDSVPLWKEYLGKNDFIMTMEYSSFGGQFRDGTEQVPAHHRKTSNRTPCGWLWKGTVVLQNGDVTLCAGDYEGLYAMGNIREQTLRSIWTGEKYNTLRRLHLEGDYRDAGLCSKCDEWMYGDGSRYQNLLKEP